MVWIVAHEAFHFLRRTRQVAGRNTEIFADQFADDRLAEFQAQRRPKSLFGQLMTAVTGDSTSRATALVR